MINRRKRGPRDAMGPRDFDYLVMANAWARVTITRTGAREYTLAGDGAGTFDKLTSAIAGAWAALAEFQRGRFD